MPQQFHKGCGVGVLLHKRRLLLRGQSTIRRLSAETVTLFSHSVFLDDTSILSKLDPGAWPKRHGNVERRSSNDEVAQGRTSCPAVSILTELKSTRQIQSRWMRTKTH